jgi:hypothetical protein
MFLPLENKTASASLLVEQKAADAVVLVAGPALDRPGMKY